MFSIPSEADVNAVAESLGMHLSAEEVSIYRSSIIEQLKNLDAFMPSRLEESRLPLLFPARDPGHRPVAEEDPYNAWLWKCQIGGAEEGVLAGLTVSFKDTIPVAGIPLTHNSYVLDGFIPDFDATVVTRVLAAGGRVTGKNTMNGFTGGKGWGGAAGDYWAPCNPHSPGHVTGGSSSGCAAAVAAGEVDVAFGGDAGGSVRVPAAFCGIVGLKGTYGLIPNTGVAVDSDQSVDNVGPMARYVEHVAAALEAVAGYDGFDPRQGRQVPGSLAVVRGLEDGIAGLRIGVLEEGFDATVDADVHSGVLAAIDTLAGLGATVTRVHVPAHRTVAAAAAGIWAEGARALRDTTIVGAWARTHYPVRLVTAMNRMWAEHSDLLSPRSKLNFLQAEFSRRNFHGAAYAKSQNVRPAFIRAYDEVLADVDVLALPTCLTTAPPVNDQQYAGDADSVRAELAVSRTVARSYTQNTRPFNYTGHPAIAVPCGKSRGLPYSLQLVGKFFDEATLLRVAYAFQSAVDWEKLISLGS